LPPGLGGRKKGDIELYAFKRYLTVTGHRVKGALHTVEPRQEAITELYAQLWGEEDKSNAKTAGDGNGEWHPTDEELLDKAFAAANGDKLKRLFEGDITGYRSHSEADLALCSVLAFWTDDPAQIDRIFRSSRLMREKWDKKDGAWTYGERTIEKALANRTEHYEYRGNDET